MDKPELIPCKRPYELGKRRKLTGLKRSTILAAARKQLESNGFLHLTMESLARESGVTRQTIHNLFGTKAEVLEALFDQLALDGGLDRMRNVMQQTDGSVILAAFVEVFTGFWAKDRMLIRRIHGIAAIDPEFGKGVEARNRRRQMAAGRVVARLNGTNSETDERERTHKAAELSALTSFEFFDALVEGCGSVEDAVSSILKLAKKALAPGS